MANHFTTIAIGASRQDETTGEPVFNADAFNARDKWNFCEQVRPMPAELKDTQSPRDKPNWYEWANENWGTKWGTYSEEAKNLGGDQCPVSIEFQSAWGPPLPEVLREIAEWMDKTLGVESVIFVGHDPYDSSVTVLEPGLADRAPMNSDDMLAEKLNDETKGEQT